MNAREQLLAQIQSAAEEVLEERAPQLTEATQLGDSTIDSLDLVEILMVIEDRHGIVIEGEAMAEVSDIAGVIDVLVANQVGEAV